MDTIRLPLVPRIAATASLRRLATRVFTLLFRWRERAHSRAMLAALDDRLLADIGLGRAEVAREVDKPFWR